MLAWLSADIRSFISLYFLTHTQHGVNRLAGNSLLECTVFGTIVGQKLPILLSSPLADVESDSSVQDPPSRKLSKRQIISASELRKHNVPEDCWVAIHGLVYDLTDFADEHPAGAESITDLAGKDGTEAFSSVHNQRTLDEFDEEIVGVYEPA